MTVRAEVKVRRGCGFRKAGGLYLIGSPIGRMCDRLIFKLRPCPTCGHLYEFNRGITQVTGVQIFHSSHDSECGGLLDCKCQVPNGPPTCPVCFPTNEVAGLMWVGKKFYTPETFSIEAEALGICKRIPYFPPWLEVGKTWVFLAHSEAYVNLSPDAKPDEQGRLFTRVPGIFKAFVPQAVEQVLNESEATEAVVEELEKQGINVVTVPDNDPDHH